MKLKYFLHLLVGIIFLSCENTPPEPTSAELWGQHLISTEAPEFATTVNADGTEVFFNRTTPDRSSMWLMRAVKGQDGQWSEPQQLPFTTGQYLDVDPFLSHDGNRLYFSSDRPATPADTFDILNTWYVDRTETGWSDPVLAPAPLNSDSTEIFISMTQSGDAFFVSERDGHRGIVVCRFENGAYQPAERVDLKLRGEPIYASNPSVASDGSFLIVAARDPEGTGSPDLFITRYRDGEWTELENLGPEVNSPWADFAPGLSKDDKILYFSSERPGIVPEQEEGVRPPGDIYWVRMTNDE